MASLFLRFVGLFFVLTSEVISTQKNSSDYNVMMVEEDELIGLFGVMSSLLDDPNWSMDHPFPCTDTPWPGVECETSEEDSQIFHVTKIHIGPDVSSPPCKPSANLSNESFLKLSYLKTLSIFNCFVISSLPITLSPTLFSSLSCLEHLSFESNPGLSGEFPPSVAQLHSLRVLSLSQNNLQGKIPVGFGELVNLEQLDLSYNNLNGEIPEEIGSLKSLSILDLSWNSFEGFVPCSLGQLHALQKVDLSYNKLTGEVPQEIGKLNRLLLFDLSFNHINGPIPETLSGLEQLQYLMVDHNPINSGIPLFVGSLKRLTSISFSGCGLIGSLPNNFSLLRNLTALSLDNNNLTGKVPTSLGSLPNLHLLNLSQNMLSGELKFSEEFIDKLGNRLDVKENKGLCTKSNMKKKKYFHLEIPVCLMGKENDGGEIINKTCPNGMKQSWSHGNSSSSADQCKIFPFSFSFLVLICFINFLL